MGPIRYSGRAKQHLHGVLDGHSKISHLSESSGRPLRAIASFYRPLSANDWVVQLFVAEPCWAVVDVDFERDIELYGAGHQLGDPFGVHLGFDGWHLE